METRVTEFNGVVNRVRILEFQMRCHSEFLQSRYLPKKILFIKYYQIFNLGTYLQFKMVGRYIMDGRHSGFQIGPMVILTPSGGVSWTLLKHSEASILLLSAPIGNKPPHSGNGHFPSHYN